MSTWAVYLLLVLAVSGCWADVAASDLQHPDGLEPALFVGFDDILPIARGNDPVKKVYIREASDFSIDDDLTLQNTSVVVDESKDALSDGDSDGNGSAGESIASEEKIESSAENQLEETKDSVEGNLEIKSEGVMADSDNEENVSAEYVVDKSNEVKSEDISVENMAVVTDPTIGGTDYGRRSRLVEAVEGSGDDDSDSESEGDNRSESTPSVINISGSSEKGDSDEVEGTTLVDILIDSEETTDTPDEIPIPNPIANSLADPVSESKEEDTTVDAFKVDELIKVTTEIVDVAKEEDSEGSGADSGEETDNVTEKHDNDREESEENESTTENTELPFKFPHERKFGVPLELNPTEPTSEENETTPQEAEETEDIPEIKKAILTGSNDISINEMGVTNNKTLEEVPGEKVNSSYGSFIILGAIMVTIVALLLYTVVKSRRQKKARRSADIAKEAAENPGREMKEVEKLLAPKTNGFSNGGPMEDYSDAVGNEVPIRGEEFPIRLNGGAGNGHLPEKEVDALTDVIVENVPRLSTTPVGNGTMPSDNENENEPGNWVYGDGKALETTKIKMYIDEDSIPKTPIVVVNRGPSPNEM